MRSHIREKRNGPYSCCGLRLASRSLDQSETTKRLSFSVPQSGPIEMIVKGVSYVKQNKWKCLSLYKHGVLQLPYPFIDQHCFAVQNTVAIAAGNIQAKQAIIRGQVSIWLWHNTLNKHIQQTQSTNTLNTHSTWLWKLTDTWVIWYSKWNWWAPRIHVCHGLGKLFNTAIWTV